MTDSIECSQGYVFGISLYLRESEQLIRARAKTKSIDIPQGQRLVNKLIGVKESDDDSLSGMSGLTSQPQSPSIGTKDQSVPSSEDDEIECMQESIKINLRCPISLLRIKEPVKGVACQHVEVRLFIWLLYVILLIRGLTPQFQQ